MPGKCETCNKFIFMLNTCTLCPNKYCDKCSHHKYLQFSYSPYIFPLSSHSMYVPKACPYTKRVAYYIELCSNCYYNYNVDITENCVTDSILANLFLQKVIKDYDIIIIYDDPATSNNSAFLFLSDMHKLINQESNQKYNRYPYELFYYAQLPNTPWMNKKESPAYKQSINRFSPDVADIISVYDSVFLDEQKLRQLADRFIQSTDNNTKALAGFLTLCAKYEIALWPFAPYPQKKPSRHLSLHSNNDETNIIQQHRAMCHDILKHHVAITPFRKLTKKAVIVVPADVSVHHSGSFNVQMQLENQLKYVLCSPPYNQKKYRIATVEKRFFNNSTVKLIKDYDNFLLTY